LSAHVLAALGTSRSWFVLHGAILLDSMRSANNPHTNPSQMPEARPGAAARHQRRAMGLVKGLKPLRLDTQLRAGGEFGPP
jgi:hypothetical protein